MTQIASLQIAVQESLVDLVCATGGKKEVSKLGMLTVGHALTQRAQYCALAFFGHMPRHRYIAWKQMVR